RPLRTLLIALAAASPLGGQIVSGTLLLRDGTTPISGAIVLATDARGETASRTLSGERGDFTLRLPAAGRYELRVLRIGYRPFAGPAVDVAPGATQQVRVLYTGDAVTLATVNVRERENCRVRPD